MENKEYFIWLRDDDQPMADCYAATIIRVYGEEQRNLIWDLFKSEWATEFFTDEELQKKYVVFENYFLQKIKKEMHIELEVIDHDTLSFYGAKQ